MDTGEIAKALKLTAQLMELHEENPFKVRSISNAAFKLDKTDISLGGMGLEELEKVEGIGKGIAHKIFELKTSGTTKELDLLMAKTPAGVIEMMRVKGLGPKKVGKLWKELGIGSVGELLYACHENRLVELKGFGTKTQEEVRKSIEFFRSNSGKFHYASVENLAKEILEEIKGKAAARLISLTGDMRRKCEVVDKIQVLVATETPPFTTEQNGITVELLTCTEKDFYLRLFETTSSPAHLEKLGSYDKNKAYASEEEIYRTLGLPFIEPELREGRNEAELARQNKLPRLIEFEDLKGILHNHSKYSDGMHTLREMAEYCKELGYQYFGICDHSQTAVYAKGLKPERVLEQHAEIDKLNAELAPFKIFRGIESDILGDGSLDYTEDILKTFDFVVASVHSNLKMDEAKATARLIRAVENPFTTILGHMTGRLLLYREGYPVDHKKVIDACAANDVVIELNAHPYRLDIDWRWIPYCLDKGVLISINPDAHEKQGFFDMRYGINVARKGMLTKENCLNAMSLQEIEGVFGR